MNKITRFDRQVLAVLKVDMKTSLESIREKFGLKELDIESITFNELSFTMKCTGKIAGDETENWDQYEAKFFAQYHGLPEDILNREFTSGNKSFRILRIEPRNPKYPIIAICKQDEKLYKFAVEVVKPLFC